MICTPAIEESNGADLDNLAVGLVDAAVTMMRTRSGRPLHPVGLGTWTFGDAPAASPDVEAEIAAIRYALRLGQNHIDTAEDYAHGGAEQVVGQAIQGLRREDLFVASKLWRDHVAKDTVRPAVEAMLQRLGTDYLDLLYIHYPWRHAPWREALPQIDELIDEGMICHLGVSNFDADQLQEAARLTKHWIAADQIPYSCSHRQAASAELVHVCQTSRTAVVAYRPLEQGDLVGNAVIVEIGRHHGATPAQVALAWLLAKDALPIPKALRRDHVEQNAAASGLRLLADDVALIDRSF